MVTRLPLIRMGLSREAVPKANSFLANACGLTEATSKARGDAFAGPPGICVCARIAGEWPMPITRGPARATTLALASKSFFARFRFCPMRQLIIDSIRFRSEEHTSELQS